jgi:hypothetical protein
MCISINIRRTNAAFFLCLRLCTSKVPLLVLMLISSCEPGLKRNEILPSEHSSPKMRVEIVTLARGARAHIESTQFIIMTIIIINRVDIIIN